MLTWPSLLYDRKLVAAEARWDVGLTKNGSQALPHLDQQLIAGGMAQRIVDGLEFIEVKHHDGDGAAISLQALARLCQL